MFIDLKELRNNIGAKVKLTLKSNGVYQQKQYNTANGPKSFNVFEFQVEKNGELRTLSASDALKRKLDDLDIGDSFLLSWEEFTTQEGQLRNYWKVDQVAKTKNEFENYLNDAKADTQVDQVVNKAVDNKALNINNGARFGMIFNNTFKLYMSPEVGACAWTAEQFAKEFLRVSKMVEYCETIKITEPKPPVNNEMEQEKSPPEVISADDLPF